MRDRELAGQEGAQGGVRGTPSEPEEGRASDHALVVLEYERIREVLSSYAASILGRQIAARVSPLKDISRVEALLRETQEMRDLLRTERLALQGLQDVAAELREVVTYGRVAEPPFLYRVVEMIDAGKSARAKLTASPDLFPELARLGGGIPALDELADEIRRIVDPREGVRDDASERLAQLRREIRDLREVVRAKVQTVRRRDRLGPAFASEGITVKNGRYVLAVKTDYRSWVPGPIRDRSHKGGTLYIEPDEAVIDADRLELLLDKERDEETRLLLELTRTVLDRRREIERLQRRLARVDFTYAKASWAAAFRLECPEVALDGDLELHEARHPWLLWLARDRTRDIRDPDIEALEKRVVPLDLRLGESSRILIITGPNTGGKTVVLKAVGLCVLLALSGIPIPARRGSRVPLYSSVFADIGDEQSLEQSLSTFSAHLTRIVEVLRHADERSLILLDELGSGTDPLEGAALGRALLDHFRARDWSVVITTHLGSLKQYAFLHEGVDNAAMEFDRENLRPTYRLLLGVPGSSSALAIAKRLGLPDEIIQDAAKEIEAVEEPTRELISSMERSRRRIEKERRRAERVRQRAQVGAREYEERLRELEERRELLEREAELEVERVVREAREKLRALAERLKSVPQTHRPAVDALLEAIEGLLAATPLGERREAFARSLKKDDRIYVPRFRATGTVRKINKSERRLTALVNGIPVDLTFDDVTWLTEEDVARGSAPGG